MSGRDKTTKLANAVKLLTMWMGLGEVLVTTDCQPKIRFRSLIVSIQAVGHGCRMTALYDNLGQLASWDATESCDRLMERILTARRDAKWRLPGE